MFEERTVYNAHINFKDRLYGSPELAGYQGQTVKVSENRLYPAAVGIHNEEYGFICLAKNQKLWDQFSRLGNRQQVLNAIETAILREEVEDGPVALRPYTIDEWVSKVRDHAEEAGRHASYGNIHHSLDSLLKAAMECVQCLEYHIEREAVKGAPALQEAIAQLDGDYSSDGQVQPSDDKKTTYPAATG